MTQQTSYKVSIYHVPTEQVLFETDPLTQELADYLIDRFVKTLVDRIPRIVIDADPKSLVVIPIQVLEQCVFFVNPYVKPAAHASRVPDNAFPPDHAEV